MKYYISVLSYTRLWRQKFFYRSGCRSPVVVDPSFLVSLSLSNQPSSHITKNIFSSPKGVNYIIILIFGQGKDRGQDRSHCQLLQIHCGKIEDKTGHTVSCCRHTVERQRTKYTVSCCRYTVERQSTKHTVS